MVLEELAGPGFDQAPERERVLVHAYWQDDPGRRPICGKDMGSIEVVTTEEPWDTPLYPYDRCAECARIAVEVQV